jgi:hypothetical protein
MANIETLEDICKISGEDPTRAIYIGAFLKQALLDEHIEMRQEAIERLKQERIGGYRVIKSFEADNEVLILLDLNESEDSRLTNPQLIPLTKITEDYQRQVYHFKINYI